MQVLTHNFPLFKGIFPSYDVFKEWYSSTPLSDGINDCPTLRTFTLIAYEFNDNNSSFSTEGFKEHFASTLYTYYREFEETTSEIISLLNIKDDEIAISDQMITNMANIPETENTTDAETVDYVSQQQKTINRKGNLQIRREQLSNKRTFTTKTFINRFRYLFIKIISPAFLEMIAEPNNE